MTALLTNTALGRGGWAPAGELPWAHSHFGAAGTAVVLADGTVLVAGGGDAALTAAADAALFDPATGAWSVTGSLREGRRIHSTVLLADGKVLVAGGQPGPIARPMQALASAELYDPVTRAWSPAGAMSQARYGHSATLLADGRVLVAGGNRVRSSRTNGPLNSAELYDPETHSWTPAEPMTDARFYHPAVTLPDGRVLVVGGWVPNSADYGVGLGYCELYQPATGKWAPAGNLSTPRHSHRATLLADGTVLVTGGGDPGAAVDGGHINPYSRATTERYDPASDTWTPDTPMPTGRTHHHAVLLPSGRVLVVGGSNDVTLDTGYQNAVLYDPGTRLWTPTPAMTTPRWDFAATALPDGRVLAVGGAVRTGAAAPQAYDDLFSSTAELFTE